MLARLTGASASGSLRGEWPTPTADAYLNSPLTPEMGERFRRKGSCGSFVEAMAAHMWPTPMARDWRSGRVGAETFGKNSRPLSEQVGGQLNPDWVEALMGWPRGWTALEPLAALPALEAVQAAWADGIWEAGLERVVPPRAVEWRVARLKAIGNGQVPQCAAAAYAALHERLGGESPC